MIQMSDALAANTAYISSDELIAFCLAHGRRNFVKIIDSFPVECRLVIEAIGTIYYHDSLSKKESHTPEQRLAFHQERSGPVMAELKAWLDLQLSQQQVEPNSNLGKAIKYLLNYWDGLTLFLRQAGAPLDSNAVERSLKKVVLHRKNSLFYKTARGARVGDIYLSLIATCQLSKVNPITISRPFKSTPRNFERPQRIGCLAPTKSLSKARENRFRLSSSVFKEPRFRQLFLYSTGCARRRLGSIIERTPDTNLKSRM